jgi:hypothetical protein
MLCCLEFIEEGKFQSQQMGFFIRMANDRINKNYTKRRKISIKTMTYRQNSGTPYLM